MKQKRFTVFLFCLIAASGAAVDKTPAEDNILRVAHELAGTVFKGWTYGNYSSSKKHLDCTTFISAVADTVLSRQGMDYTAAMRRDVLIDHSDHGRNVVQQGPDPDDPRYAGIVHA
ncbi:MAG: hypothetical protein K0B52_07080, partial [FCB group bacterium]|nr:hypothetical protein [FCB group bacterium]